MDAKPRKTKKTITSSTMKEQAEVTNEDQISKLAKVRYDSFGTYVATRLGQLTQDAARSAELIINQLLYDIEDGRKPTITVRNIEEDPSTSVPKSKTFGTNANQPSLVQDIPKGSNDQQEASQSMAVAAHHSNNSSQGSSIHQLSPSLTISSQSSTSSNINVILYGREAKKIPDAVVATTSATKRKIFQCSRAKKLQEVANSSESDSTVDEDYNSEPIEQVTKKVFTESDHDNTPVRNKEDEYIDSDKTSPLLISDSAEEISSGGIEEVLTEEFEREPDSLRVVEEFLPFGEEDGLQEEELISFATSSREYHPRYEQSLFLYRNEPAYSVDREQPQRAPYQTEPIYYPNNSSSYGPVNRYYTRHYEYYSNDSPQ